MFINYRICKQYVQNRCCVGSYLRLCWYDPTPHLKINQKIRNVSQYRQISWERYFFISERDLVTKRDICLEQEIFVMILLEYIATVSLVQASCFSLRLHFLFLRVDFLLLVLHLLQAVELLPLQLI